MDVNQQFVHAMEQVLKLWKLLMLLHYHTTDVVLQNVEEYSLTFKKEKENGKIYWT